MFKGMFYVIGLAAILATSSSAQDVGTTDGPEKSE
jgi:hypothetical protein